MYNIIHINHSIGQEISQYSVKKCSWTKEQHRYGLLLEILLRKKKYVVHSIRFRIKR